MGSFQFSFSSVCFGAMILRLQSRKDEGKLAIIVVLGLFSIVFQFGLDS